MTVDDAFVYDIATYIKESQRNCLTRKFSLTLMQFLKENQAAYCVQTIPGQKCGTVFDYVALSRFHLPICSFCYQCNMPDHHIYIISLKFGPVLNFSLTLDPENSCKVLYNPHKMITMYGTGVMYLLLVIQSINVCVGDTTLTYNLIQNIWFVIVLS